MGSTPRPSSKERWPGPALVARAGFTLLEIVIVLILMGITGAVVLPALLRAATPNSADTMAAPLVQLLQSAQRAATARDVAVTVTLDPVTAAYRAEADGADSALAAGVLPLAATVRLTADSVRARFLFWPDGSAYGDSLMVRNGATTVVVRVDPWNGAVSAVPR